MNPRNRIYLPLLFFLSACASHEGTYSPACIAFAGDEIELDDGRIRWDKFTDQVVIDDHGETVDQFPDYPKGADYRIDGNRLIIESSSGMPVDTLFLLRRDRSVYLLTPQQHDEWRQTGEYPECALVLGGRASD